MATKTISIDMEAYERLRRARRTPDESFSKVIKRAEWRDERKTVGSFLRAMESVPVTDEATLERLEQIQREDAPPDDPWRSD